MYTSRFKWMQSEMSQKNNERKGVRTFCLEGEREDKVDRVNKVLCSILLLL